MTASTECVRRNVLSLTEQYLILSIRAKAIATRYRSRPTTSNDKYSADLVSQVCSASSTEGPNYEDEIQQPVMRIVYRWADHLSASRDACKHTTFVGNCTRELAARLAKRMAQAQSFPWPTQHVQPLLAESRYSTSPSYQDNAVQKTAWLQSTSKTTSHGRARLARTV